MFGWQKRTGKVFQRTKNTTDPKFGKRPEDRSIQELLTSSIVIIDKPAGPTSHQVSSYVRDILGIKKTGHSGTLDPKVVGVLPVALGKGTRVVQNLLPAGKEYVVLMHVHDDLAPDVVNKAIMSFLGRINQLPPVKSAVKRRQRFRTIYEIELLDAKGRDYLFRVQCQAGTYMRKLCSDIGQKLGCGAHMAELRRTMAGPFSEKDAVTLHDLKDAFYYYTKEGDETKLRKMLLPLERAVEHLPKIWVEDSAINSLCTGSTLKIPGINKFEIELARDDSVALLSLKNELVSVGTALVHGKDLRQKEKGIAVKSSQVFMDPSVYPKIENILASK
ncbi:MAG: RNA-guided pseudouridylation complex pseudouridine synthase subunit Cbf5 [Candidatus Woesearchaeota archaeon]|nr:MAG: RNA-guided pseudouridylation complex pseudouridine synthase subunit Cbf5 [Candidatus Woesearchaeota archaeon]